MAKGQVREESMHCNEKECASSRSGSENRMGLPMAEPSGSVSFTVTSSKGESSSTGGSLTSWITTTIDASQNSEALP